MAVVCEPGIRLPSFILSFTGVDHVGIPLVSVRQMVERRLVQNPSQMYIRSGVGRRAVPVAIQGFEVLIESISELRDNVRETLRQSAWIWYNGVKR
jgi:hypothetical protein